MAAKSAMQADYDAMRQVGAIVLGGGRGTRLYPLTAVRAKPAVPLCGRYRLVDIPLSNCINSGCTRIVVLTQFNSHSLNRHIMSAYHFNEFTPGGVTILAAEQTNETGDWFQGTADAVRKHLLHIRDIDTAHYLVLSGDQLYRMDYRQLMATHVNKGADITVSALPVSRRDATGFGVMKVNKETRIREFVEKPRDEAVLDDLITPEKVFQDFGLEAEGKPYLASMGVYAFKAEVLEEVLTNHPEWVDFGKQIIPNTLKSHQVYAHMFYGFWEDIGTVRSYFDMSIAMTRDNPPFEFHDPRRPIYTHTRALPGAKMQDARVTNAIICSGSRIDRAVIKDSIIGIRSIIHAGAAIERSVVLGADYFENEQMRQRHSRPIGIGKNARIRQAIIDHNARIGKNTVIQGHDRLKDSDGEGYSIRDGIVVIHKNAVIPDGAVIGSPK
jgi:glucose-1-phosphate adenylyltransferase